MRARGRSELEDPDCSTISCSRATTRGLGHRLVPTWFARWLWPRVALPEGSFDAELVRGVAERLQGSLHMPVVRGALRCLIPEWLDPLDGRQRKPRAATWIVWA